MFLIDVLRIFIILNDELIIIEFEAFFLRLSLLKGILVYNVENWLIIVKGISCFLLFLRKGFLYFL